MYGYTQQADKTIAGKVSPLLTLAAQGLSGKNFFGQPYRDPQGDQLSKATDTAKFMASQLVPISTRQYAPEQLREDKGPNPDTNISWPERQFGAPAPSFITNPHKADDADTKAYKANIVSKFERGEKWESRLRTALATNDSATENAVQQELAQAVEGGKIPQADADKITKRAGMSTKGLAFAKMPLTLMVPAFEHMTPKSKAEVADIFEKKKPAAGTSDAEKEHLQNRVEELLAQ
jgi:hypothetical protein